MTGPIVVFTALAWESAAVRSVLRQVRREGEGVWRGSSGRRDILIVTGGIGPWRARQTIKEFTDTPLSAVLSVGCAGALIPELTAGQLVLAPALRMYTEEREGQLHTFGVDSRLFHAARDAAQRAGVATIEGGIVTSPRVLFTRQEKEKRGRETDCIAVEMESGVHATFAVERTLPFLVLRVILDSVDMTIPPMKGVTTAEGKIRLSKAMAHIATRPQHLPFFIRLQQCRRRAAETISRVCRTFFPRLDTMDLSE